MARALYAVERKFEEDKMKADVEKIKADVKKKALDEFKSKCPCMASVMLTNFINNKPEKFAESILKGENPTNKWLRFGHLEPIRMHDGTFFKPEQFLIYVHHM